MSYIQHALSDAPFPVQSKVRYIPASSTNPRGRWQVTYTNKDTPTGCYAYLAVQDYGSAENSLCRINEELQSPNPPAGYVTPPTPTSPYADAGYVYTDAGHTFSDVVNFLGQFQVGTMMYCPGQPTGSFAADAVRLGKEAVNKLSTFTPPTDAAGSSWSEAISYVAWQGIASGYADGTFRPNTTINRAEFTKIVIGTLAQARDITGSACFSDITNEWFAPFACTAKSMKILSGYPDGTFQGANTVTVAEALKIVIGALLPDKVVAHTGDAWYLPYVSAAKNAGVYLQSFDAPDHQLTRGEMAELIYRLQMGMVSPLQKKFLVLSPVVDGGTATVSQLPVVITGRAPAGSTITVNGGYTLSSCCKTEVADGTWTYNVDTKWKNIAAGDTAYEFVATDSAGNEVGREKIVLRYTP